MHAVKVARSGKTGLTPVRLPALGYTLSLSDPTTGRLVTGRLPFGVRLELGLYGRDSTPLWRQYELRVLRVDPGYTRVIAVPHQYAGERDISSDRVWTLDGPQGEHAQWQALFTQIGSSL